MVVCLIVTLVICLVGSLVVCVGCGRFNMCVCLATDVWWLPYILSMMEILMTKSLMKLMMLVIILDIMMIIMKNYPFSETRYGRGDLKRGFQRSRLRWSRWSGTLWWIIRKGHDLIDLSDISCIHHPHPHLDRCHNDNVKSTIAFIKSLNIVKISAGPADP